MSFINIKMRPMVAKTYGTHHTKSLQLLNLPAQMLVKVFVTFLNNRWQKLHIFFKNYFQVPTTTDEICQFPFRHNGVDYNRCLIDKSVQGSYLPMCKIKSGAWRRCQVPTNAIITKVTTSRKGNSYNAGTEGGTLVYISGLSNFI